MRTCRFCAGPMKDRRASALYCGWVCRQKAGHCRKKGRKIAAREDRDNKFLALLQKEKING